MKILVVNWQDRLNPHAGGAEVHLHQIFGRLAGHGHQVEMLVSGWPGAPAREIVDGLRITRAGTRWSFGVVAPRAFRRHYSPGAFDVVIEALNKVPVFAPRWVGAPVVLLVHHLFGATAFREASLPLAAATWLLERPLPAAYRGLPVQAISQSTADDLVARGFAREQIRVIRPGVDLHFFHPDPSVPRTAEPTFVYVGRLKRYKRVDLILRAVASLRARGIRPKLIIAGRGDHQSRLLRLADQLGVSDQVRFPGFVSEAEKRALFRTAWANVFTSPKEGWGITNVEAAACGTPTIASDSPGLRESVVPNQTGLLVAHDSVELLADAMASLAADRDRVERLGSNARIFAEQLGWEVAAEATLDHLQEVVQPQGTSLAVPASAA